MKQRKIVAFPEITPDDDNFCFRGCPEDSIPCKFMWNRDYYNDIHWKCNLWQEELSFVLDGKPHNPEDMINGKVTLIEIPRPAICIEAEQLRSEMGRFTISPWWWRIKSWLKRS
jgi:hypothetical protein